MGTAALGECFESTREHRIPELLHIFSYVSKDPFLCLFSFADSFLPTRAGAHQDVPPENECCGRADSLPKGRKKDNLHTGALEPGRGGSAWFIWTSSAGLAFRTGRGARLSSPRSSCASCSEANVLKGRPSIGRHLCLSPCWGLPSPATGTQRLRGL